MVRKSQLYSYIGGKIKKKIFRALYSVAEKVLSNEEKKKLDKEIDAKITESIDKMKNIKTLKKKSDKK